MIKHRHVCGFVAALQIISIGFEYLIINDSNKNAKLAVKLFLKKKSISHPVPVHLFCLLAAWSCLIDIQCTSALVDA